VTTRRIVAALAVGAMLAAGCGSPSAPSAATRVTSGAAATKSPGTVSPELRFTAKTLDGQDFTGASLMGKPAVLWFWTPWCPTCQGEAPMVGRVAAAHPGVTFVGVGGQDQIPAMKEFVDKYKASGFTELADTDGTVWANFGVTRQPAFAFIHPDGSVVLVKGPLSEADLTERVSGISNR